MNKQVIGYYYTLTEDFLDYMKSEPHEFVNATLQFCIGRVTSVNDDNSGGKIETEDPDDIIEKMLSQNIGTIVSVDGNNAKVLFNNPIPGSFLLYFLSHLDRSRNDRVDQAALIRVRRRVFCRNVFAAESD